MVFFVFFFFYFCILLLLFRLGISFQVLDPSCSEVCVYILFLTSLHSSAERGQAIALRAGGWEETLNVPRYDERRKWLVRAPDY